MGNRTLNLLVCSPVLQQIAPLRTPTEKCKNVIIFSTGETNFQDYYVSLCAYYVTLGILLKATKN
jgi:hypothetical protein